MEAHQNALGFDLRAAVESALLRVRVMSVRVTQHAAAAHEQRRDRTCIDQAPYLVAKTGPGYVGGTADVVALVVFPFRAHAHRKVINDVVPFNRAHYAF